MSKRSDVLPIGKVIIERVHRTLLNGGLMRKLSILFVLALMLAGVSAQAQKKNRIQPIPPPVKNILSVQDQDGGGYILFDITTGDFK